MPEWSKNDQALAVAVQKMLGNPETAGLKTKVDDMKEPVKPEQRTGGGSDDIGDIMWTVPTVTLRYPSNIPDLPATIGPTQSRWLLRLHTRVPFPAPRLSRSRCSTSIHGPNWFHKRGTTSGIANQGNPLQASDASGRQASHLAQSKDHVGVSRPSAATLLRSFKIRQLSGTAGNQISDTRKEIAELRVCTCVIRGIVRSTASLKEVPLYAPYCPRCTRHNSVVFRA